MDIRNSVSGKDIYFSLRHHNQALLKSTQWIPRDLTPAHLLQNVSSETDSVYSSHQGDPRSIPGQSTKDLWLIKWHLHRPPHSILRFSPVSIIPPIPHKLTSCIYHPGYNDIG